MEDDTKEDKQWKDAWDKLHEQVDSSKMPLAQYNAMVKLWHEISKAIEGLRRPTFGNDDGSLLNGDDYFFNWWFKDIPDYAASIYVRKDGKYEWYFGCVEENDFDGSGDIFAVLKAMLEPMKVFANVKSD